jgi:hypothetical protein
VGDHILLAPAFNVSAADIHMIVERTTRVIEDYFGEPRDLGMSM